jgi:hypothetical protein
MLKRILKHFYIPIGFKRRVSWLVVLLNKNRAFTLRMTSFPSFFTAVPDFATEACPRAVTF